MARCPHARQGRNRTCRSLGENRRERQHHRPYRHQRLTNILERALGMSPIMARPTPSRNRNSGKTTHSRWPTHHPRISRLLPKHERAEISSVQRGMRLRQSSRNSRSLLKALGPAHRSLRRELESGQRLARTRRCHTRILLMGSVQSFSRCLSLYERRRNAYRWRNSFAGHYDASRAGVEANYALRYPFAECIRQST
jgi:hypothetical protein